MNVFVSCSTRAEADELIWFIEKTPKMHIMTSDVLDYRVSPGLDLWSVSIMVDSDLEYLFVRASYFRGVEEFRQYLFANQLASL